MCCVSDLIHGNHLDQESLGSMQETRPHRTETWSREGCHEFKEQWQCVCQLDNWQQKVWMPIRLLQNLFVAAFQGLLSLAIKTPKEDNLCNEMSQDSVILCHSSSTLDIMSYLHPYNVILKILREKKQNRPFPRQFFLSEAKNGGHNTCIMMTRSTTIQHDHADYLCTVPLLPAWSWLSLHCTIIASMMTMVATSVPLLTTS